VYTVYNCRRKAGDAGDSDAETTDCSGDATSGGGAPVETS